MTEIVALSERNPQVSSEELLAGFHPSYRFGEVSFDTYIPDPAHPSQAEAVERLKAFAASMKTPKKPGGFFSMFRRDAKKANTKNGNGQPNGIYLDGGFGVGKTHLLASLWHAAPGRKAFGTFVEYTNLVGALSFTTTVEVLKEYSLVCIDEFELDDPGDTVLMSRLMRELSDAGVKLAATSNTLPGALGEGRFAAQDFKREIQVLSDQFETIRVDGEDFRHRGLESAPEPVSVGTELQTAKDNFPDENVFAVDDWTALTKNLSRVHPSRYRELVKDVDVLVLKDVTTITEQAMALRFVVLADRLYDKDVPVVASGVPFEHLFTEDMMAGGYMKKYFRTVSRMTALAREGQLGEKAL
ncbi:cell division protein ZapE [Enteractinococcus coprophilus]|uniref:Cell division protein ZapE n=1 Tax=Enteractinococcus coprophilus TaxID=1027633 RepID=A0A543AJ21_9MICC|nr:cell division protein ZapE [Enteractinococcus coprophilus]TQL72579.1 cell division protein ZapE [Enteractinococcus coprophilus]